MDKPLVSVIIPTFNRAGIIGKAIQSVFDQTYTNTEIIVVDDGSADETPEVLAKYGNHIRVFRQANAGPSAARNRGVDAAQGEVVAFLDSDDAWLPTKLARQVELLRRAGPEIPCCLSNICLSHSPYGKETSFALANLHPKLPEGVWSNPLEILLTRFILFNQAIAVRRDALRRVGAFNPKLRLLEDYDLALRLALLGSWTFISEPLVSYGTSQSNALSRTATSDATLAPKASRTILEDLLGNGKVTNPTTRKYIRRRIRAVEWQLRAANYVKSENNLLTKVGWFLECAVRLRKAVSRSFFWPQMRECPLSN